MPLSICPMVVYRFDISNDLAHVGAAVGRPAPFCIIRPDACSVVPLRRPLRVTEPPPSPRLAALVQSKYTLVRTHSARTNADMIPTDSLRPSLFETFPVPSPGKNLAKTDRSAVEGAKVFATTMTTLECEEEDKVGRAIAAGRTRLHQRRESEPITTQGVLTC